MIDGLVENIKNFGLYNCRYRYVRGGERFRVYGCLRWRECIWWGVGWERGDWIEGCCVCCFVGICDLVYGSIVKNSSFYFVLDV